MADANDEFRRQIQTMLDRNYPKAANLSRADFLAHVEPLEDLLDSLPAPSHENTFPFAVVVASALVPTTYAMEHAVDRRGRAGVVNMYPLEPRDFATIPTVDVPTAPAYLLADVDTGAETLNVKPGDAMPIITGHGRTPLTIDEGVAVLTQFPDVLQSHNAYQLLASRRDDKRIPSIWKTSKGSRLGWCWEGNPHTWLGSASAMARYVTADES